MCGPSNISVDNIVERLAPHKIPIGKQFNVFPVLDHEHIMLT